VRWSVCVLLVVVCHMVCGFGHVLVLDMVDTIRFVVFIGHWMVSGIYTLRMSFENSLLCLSVKRLAFHAS